MSLQTMAITVVIADLKQLRKICEICLDKSFIKCFRCGPGKSVRVKSVSKEEDIDMDDIDF